MRQRNHEANEQNGGHHYQQPRLTASALARMQQLQGAEPAALPTTTTRSLYDVKAMQKEAVLSYVKVIFFVMWAQITHILLNKMVFQWFLMSITV